MESISNEAQDGGVFGPTKHRVRVALYARVSTLNGQDPEMQLGELREYAVRRGWAQAGEYVDKGVSGSKDRRPALNRLMLDTKARRLDVVLVWKLDRFGRSLKYLVNTLAEFESVGVAFVSLRDNLDLSTSTGRLMFHVIAAMAEFERALIQERVRAGLRRAPCTLGQAQVEIPSGRIQSLRAEGMSWADISQRTRIAKTTLLRREHADRRG